MKAKKILCLVISVAMVLSTMCLTAFAEETKIPAETEVSSAEVKLEAADSAPVIQLSNRVTGEIKTYDSLQAAVDVVTNDTTVGSDGRYPYNPHVRLSGHLVISSDTTLPEKYENDVLKGGFYISDDCTITLENGATLNAPNIWVGDNVNFTINGDGIVNSYIQKDWHGAGTFTIDGVDIQGNYATCEIFAYDEIIVKNCRSVPGFYLESDGPVTVINVTSEDNLFADSYKGTVSVNGCEAHIGLKVGAPTVKVENCNIKDGFTISNPVKVYYDEYGDEVVENYYVDTATVTNTTLYNGNLSVDGKSVDLSGLTADKIKDAFIMRADSITPSEYSFIGSGPIKTVAVSSPAKVTLNNIEIAGGTHPLTVSGSADVTINNGSISSNSTTLTCTGNGKLLLNDCTINCGISLDSVSGAAADATCGLTVKGGKFKTFGYSDSGSVDTLRKYLPKGYIAVESTEANYYDVELNADELYSFTLTPAEKVQVSANEEVDKISVSATKADGKYIDGTLITVTAKDNDFYAFDGWYIDGVKVSDEKVYELMLRGNVTISAKVKELANFDFVAPETNTDGVVVYTVSTPEELNYISYLSKEKKHSYANEIVEIVNDIDMAGINFCPIGYSTPFKGTLIGVKNAATRDADPTKNVVISNLTIEHEQKIPSCGLVGRTRDNEGKKAQIKNITLLNPNVESYEKDNFVGAIVGEGTFSEIVNCEVIGGVVNGHFAGGIVGHSDGATLVKDCTVDGTTMICSWKSGGVVGYYSGDMDIVNTTVKNYKATSDTGTGIFGAVTGHSNGSVEMTDVKVENSTVHGDKTPSLIGADYENGASITIGGENTNVDVADIVSTSHSSITITGGEYTCPIPEEAEIPTDSNVLIDNEGISVVTKKDAPPEARFLTSGVTVKFVPTEKERVYEIVIAADEGKQINRLFSSELMFKLQMIDDGAVGYEITPDAGVNMLKRGDVWEFNFDGVALSEKSGTSVKIAEVAFEGYGEFYFACVEYNDAKVNTAKFDNSIVHTFIPNGDGEESGTLKLNGTNGNMNETDTDSIVKLKFEPVKNTLTINVTFPNTVRENPIAYQDMQVTIVGRGETFKFDLGENTSGVADENKIPMTDGKYVITVPLYENTTYTVTVEGAGYRTSYCSVNMSKNKTLTFWNNVMDVEQSIEEDGATKSHTSFLAGDIVTDGKINIYDLSAVVSYFGTANAVTERSEYAKYDLNRDGVIDSKDIAYVLASWNK